VLVSRNAAYSVRTAVTIAPVTTTIRDIPVEVVLDEGDGLPRRCVVNLDDLTTIPKDLLRTRLAVLNRQKLVDIEAAIRFALELS
jgi:mRNA interferase MazF